MILSPVESGMIFGPFDSENFFYIEKSDCYRSIEKGVQIGEFILLRSANSKNEMWLIEAKQSSPKEIAGSDFVLEIKAKLENSICLMLALGIGRHVDNGLPEKFRNLDWSKLGFKLVLIIKGHELSWLPPINDCLSTALLPVRKTLNLGSDPVLVLNDELAIKYGIVEKLVS